MATVCGNITQSLDFDCDNPLQAGAEDRLILMNREDWLNATKVLNGTNPQIVEDITMPVGKVAFEYSGKNSSNVPRFELVKQSFAEVYNHEINFKVFKVNATAKQELERLAKGTVVAILENRFKGASGESSFEIYGADAGLIATQIVREVQSADTQGAFDVICKSDDTNSVFEPHMPKTLFNTDYATTKAIVDALLV